MDCGAECGYAGCGSYSPINTRWKLRRRHWVPGFLGFSRQDLRLFAGLAGDPATVVVVAAVALGDAHGGPCGALGGILAS